MTPTEVKQAADEMVEMFRPMFSGWHCISENDRIAEMTRCSIAHCKRVIEVLNK